MNGIYRKVLLVAALWLSAQVFVCGQEIPALNPLWQDAGRGVQVCTLRVDLGGSRQAVSALRYKASRHRTDIVNDPGAMADSTSALALRHRALGAVNGSYFDMRLLTPVTFVKDDGVVEGSSDGADTLRADGIVAVTGRRKVVVAPFDEEVAGKCREGLAAGPLLLQSGSPVRDRWPDRSFFSSRHPRTVVGTDSEGRVYFIVIDGRAPGDADGATIAEAVSIALAFGLEDAVNLDGGGSSTLWCKSRGVISHPSDNHRFDPHGQRRVPNAIVVR